MIYTDQMPSCCEDCSFCIISGLYGARCVLLHKRLQLDHMGNYSRMGDCPLHEIIHCKDCIHWRKTEVKDEITGKSEYTCNELYFEWGEENGYCFMAERRDG